MPRKKKDETAKSPSKPTPRKKSLVSPTSKKSPKTKPSKAVKPKAPKAVKPAKTAVIPKAPVSLRPVRPGSILRPIPAGRFPRQGETRMVAFVRDPLCIFTYWEVTPESIDTVKKELMEEFKGSSMVLRVFKTLENGEVVLLREIQVKPGEMNRYVELAEPTGVYYVEVAQKTKTGRVAVYARSNRIVLGPMGSWGDGGQGSWSQDPNEEPPSGMLEYFSEEWGPEGTGSPSRGLSSAETQKRARAKYSASNIGG